MCQNGRRCTEQGFLEFHHVTPYAVGGQPTVENIQLRCRAHNGYEAELDFGPRDPSVVREPRAPYLITDLVAVASTRLRNPAATRSGPSSEAAISTLAPIHAPWCDEFD
ncbi:MAG: HNH endonuclease [Acidimicrobiia bacterium]